MKKVEKEEHPKPRMETEDDREQKSRCGIPSRALIL
jgi:hypothetical protein